MKHLAFALGLLALTAATPARADFAIVEFGDGFCQIWWDSAGIPWGVGWTKITIGLPDYAVAQATLDSAIGRRVCR
jgi:hypothetical protein